MLLHCCSAKESTLVMSCYSSTLMSVRLSWQWLRGKGKVFGGSDICYLRWLIEGA